MRRIPVLLLLALLLALPVFPDDVRRELRNFEGKWSQVSLDADGNVQQSPAGGSGMTIRGDLWYERSAAGDFVSRFSIDSKKNPKQIDRMMGNGIAIPGIYTIEGDTLTISMPVPFGGRASTKRPDVFSTKPGDPFAVFVYKRVGAADDLRPPDWQSDWQASFRTAKQERRLVFVDYFAAWCGPCRTMEETVFILPTVRERLSGFVLLRIDTDRSRIARQQKVFTLPTYAVYDPGGRMRMKIVGARPANAFQDAIEVIRAMKPTFMQASDLFDQQKDLDADFLLGDTYSRLEMLDQARDAYGDAERTAMKNGQPGPAQTADVLAAFTFTREENPKRTIELLEKLVAKPADRETEARIWLTMGHAQRAARNPAAALEAYRRVQSLAAPDTAMYQEASEAIGTLPR